MISSATAAAELVSAGERVLVCGGAGVVEAVRAAGAIPFDGDDAEAVADGVDVVVAGLHRTFDYERLRLATMAIRNGARFVATNRDPLFPTPDGPIPGGGSIVAAIATASGVEPETAGKPHPPMVRAVTACSAATSTPSGSSSSVTRCPRTVASPRHSAAASPSFAPATRRPGSTVDPPPDFDGADLAAVVDELLAGRTSTPPG